MKNLTPQNVVKELDKYIIGQDKAKRAVAIALRNRWRRQQVTGELQQEIMPNNIILIGPTGVGKTEIARRLSRLANAPFIKVEASKFTEVGYVGRDVESMVRELMNIAINEVRSEMTEAIIADAENKARERLLDLLMPPPPASGTDTAEEQEAKDERYQRSREKFAAKLDSGQLNERDVEITLQNTPMPHVEIFPIPAWKTSICSWAN